MKRFAMLAGVAIVAGCAMQSQPETDEGQAQDPAELAASVKAPSSIAPIPGLRLLPNLVAVAMDGSIDYASSGQGFRYCNRDSRGNFIVRVKNIGNAPAPSTLTVVKGARASHTLTTSALNPGQEQDFVIPFDFAVCSPDCSFSITVDYSGKVSESSENNTFPGWCIG